MTTSKTISTRLALHNEFTCDQKLNESLVDNYVLPAIIHKLSSYSIILESLWCFKDMET